MKTNNPQRRCYMDCTEEQKLCFREAWSKGVLLKLGNDAKWGDKTIVGRLLDGATYAFEIKEKEEYLTPAYCFGKCLWKSDLVWIMYTDIDQNPKFFHDSGYCLKGHPSDEKSESLKVEV